MRCNHKVFHVVVHDVTPQMIDALTAIARQLRPLIHANMSAAVVPCWRGQRLTANARDFIKFVRLEFAEILLHGYTHQRAGRGGCLSALTNHADELSGLNATEAIARLCHGQRILGEVFGAAARGFVPPAWQWGALTPERLASCSLRYGVGLRSVYSIEGARRPLATWSWDAGRFAALGWLGAANGAMLFALQPRATPCIVFHPADVARGFVPHGLRLVQPGT